MIVYLDASCLVKLYVEEESSAEVRAWCGRSRALATTPVAFVEAVSAMSRRVREGGLAEGTAEEAIDRLSVDWPAYVRVAFDEREAAAIAARRGLRALDAIHIAAAVALAGAAGDVPVVFATFDARQAAAAAAEGLATLPQGARLP